jgi:hypothetical protein
MTFDAKGWRLVVGFTMGVLIAASGCVGEGEQPLDLEEESAEHVAADLIDEAAADPPATPAGAFDGDVFNRLPSRYTVKIASFTGPERCPTWQYWPGEPDGRAGPTFSCRTYWLPSGKPDDEINGRNFDTDGFMVESNYQVRGAGFRVNVPAFRWYRIRDGMNVNCELTDGRPVCYL